MASMKNNPDSTTKKTLAFNTGNPYTDHGQRIGCLAIDDGVLMADIDRGITYFLAGCPLDQNSVMAAYNSGAYHAGYPPSAQANGFSTWPEIRAEVERIAIEGNMAAPSHGATIAGANAPARLAYLAGPHQFTDAILRRAAVMFPHMDILALALDLAGVVETTKLDFAKLAGFPDNDFAHDICGITHHYSRSTGQLEDFFLPRCAA